MLNVGKLYQIKRFFWMVYPEKTYAAAAHVAEATCATVWASDKPAAVASWSDYLSRKFNCNVTYISPNSILFSVETDGKYVKVISTEGIGWMTHPDWLIHPGEEAWTKDCIEEVKEE